jgi:hypothetical protein
MILASTVKGIHLENSWISPSKLQKLGEAVLDVVCRGTAVASSAIELVEVSYKIHAFWQKAFHNN